MENEQLFQNDTTLDKYLLNEASCKADKKVLKDMYELRYLVKDAKLLNFVQKYGLEALADLVDACGGEQIRVPKKEQFYKSLENVIICYLVVYKNATPTDIVNEFRHLSKSRVQYKSDEVYHNILNTVEQMTSTEERMEKIMEIINGTGR